MSVVERFGFIKTNYVVDSSDLAFSPLPDEIFQVIFRFADYQTRYATCLVNKKWCALYVRLTLTESALAIDQIKGICKMLTLDSDSSLYFVALQPIKVSLKTCKTALIKLLQKDYMIEQNLVPLNAQYQSLPKPEGWHDLLERAVLQAKLARIVPVKTHEEMQKAFGLAELLRTCVHTQMYDAIYAIAKTHTTAETSSWLFDYVIGQLTMQDRLNENPELINRAIEFLKMISDRSFKIQSLGHIADGYFRLKKVSQGLAYFDQIVEPDYRRMMLSGSLNGIFYHFDGDRDNLTCSQVAAALRDAKENIPFGTSSIEEGIEALEDDEMKSTLKASYAAFDKNL